MISAEEIKALMARETVESEAESTSNVHGSAFNSGDYTYEDYQFVSSGIQNLADIASKRGQAIHTLQTLLKRAAVKAEQLLVYGLASNMDGNREAFQELEQFLKLIEPYIVKEGE